MGWDDRKRRKAVEYRRANRDATIEQVRPHVLRLRGEGQSFRQIARWLDKNGYPSPQRYGSNPWSGIAVKRIFDKVKAEAPQEELKRHGISRTDIGQPAWQE